MESGDYNSSEQDTATVTKELEEPLAKWNMTLWWKEETWPRPKKAMERWKNPAANGVFNAACLELGKDTVSNETVTNCLQIILIKLITSVNDHPP